jgi:hypothetical protein
MTKDIGELTRRYQRARKAFKESLWALREAEEQHKRQGYPEGRETGLPAAQAAENRTGEKVVKAQWAIREYLPVGWSDLEKKARVMGTFIDLGKHDAVALIRDIIAIATDPRT